MNRKVVFGLGLILLLISIVTLIFTIQSVKASGTIYIRSDGSIDPPTAPIQRDGNIYTFTDNIYDSIAIERDNILVDGANYPIQGVGIGAGIGLTHRSNVTIKNTRIKAFDLGIRLTDSSNNTIKNNTCSDNLFAGVYLYFSSNNTIEANIFEGSALFILESYHNEVRDCEVNGKPLIYLEDESDATVNRNAGQVISVKCQKIEIANCDLCVQPRCIFLWESSLCVIKHNICSKDGGDGIVLHGSANNEIYNNTCLGFDRDGIRLSHSSHNNTVYNNICKNGENGILLWIECHNNTLASNTLYNNDQGIWLSRSSNNTVYDNIISNNRKGIWLDPSSTNNKFYHNNFINNTRQVLSGGSPNIWDDGYPSGGNYWSDYPIRYPDVGDEYHGENQDIPGSDGIWDHPYEIDAANQDNYPLTNLWTPTIEAIIDINPDTLNLKSKGEWITCYTELPEGYNISDINVSTIMLNDTIPAELHPTEVGDYDDDGILDLMVKFDRQEVIALVSVGEATLTITGEVDDTPFEGSDTIRVIGE